MRIHKIFQSNFEINCGGLKKPVHSANFLFPKNKKKHHIHKTKLRVRGGYAYSVNIVLHVLLFISFHSENYDDANDINLQSNQMNRNETTSSLSGHSDEFSMVDVQKQTPKNEYTRSQLMDLRHDDTNEDMMEKAKNMKIAERIIKKNAERKLAEAKSGGGPVKKENEKKEIVHAMCGPVSKEEPKEPNVDDFWSKATITSSNRNAAAADQNENFALANPWEQTGYDDRTDFSSSRANNAKVGHWLNSGREKMPSQSSQCFDDFFNESNPSNPMLISNEPKRTDTSSMVSDVSVKSAARLQLLDKTAKLKQTLSKLRQNPKN